jgi:hypothetical protein
VATHFVLDQNYPMLPEVQWPPSVRISYLRDYDGRLTHDFEDWQVMLSLYQRGGVDAFVTQDRNILSSPTEMVVLSQLALSLVVTKDTGNNPMRAAGLLLAGAEIVARRIANEGHRIFLLSMRPVPKSPGDLINRIATHQSLSPPDLIRREMARVGDLVTPVVPMDSD